MVMHADQHVITVDVARELIADQFPDWREENLVEVASDGTVNAIFRIGDHSAARFPLVGVDAGETLQMLEREARAMSELAEHCPFPVPVPLAIGRPGNDYPLPWSVNTWIPGDAATPAGLASSPSFSHDLVVLIQTLRAVDTRGRAFSGTSRGGDLRGQDEWMQTCFAQSEHLLDVARLRSLWERLRDLPRTAPDVMSHGDLIPPNLLVAGERLVGVLDGGGFAPADPALDLVAAWHLLERGGRELLRAELVIDVNEWLRGVGWAFAQSMGLVWYYEVTNPGMAALGRSTIGRIIDDPELQSL